MSDKRSSSSSKEEEEPIQHRSPRLKRNRTKSLSPRTKRPKEDAGSSTAQPLEAEAVASINPGEGSRQNESRVLSPIVLLRRIDLISWTEQPVRKGAAVSIKKRGKGSRRNGCRSSSLGTGQRSINATSSTKQTRRSRSSPPSARRVKKESRRSSTQQLGNKTVSSVQRSKRDKSQSSAASAKRQKLRAGTSSSRSTLPQSSLPSTKGHKQDAGSSSAETTGSKTRKSIRMPVQLPRQNATAEKSHSSEKGTQTGSETVREHYNRIYFPESDEYAYIKHTSTDETTDTEEDPERPQRDGGGSCDQSKRSQDSSASTDQLKQVASSSPENPVPSTTFSTSTECQGQPGSPDGGDSSDEPSESTSSDERTGQQGGPGDPESPPRNVGSEVPVPSLSVQMREKIFSFVGKEGLKISCGVSNDWRDKILSLKEPWKSRCIKYGFVCSSEEEDPSEETYRNLYVSMRRWLSSFSSPEGFKIRDVGCRYQRTHKLYDYYHTIKGLNYFDNKLAIVSRMWRIRVFDLAEDRPRRIAKIVLRQDMFSADSYISSVKLTKIDERTHVVCLSDDCRLFIWDIEDSRTERGEKWGRKLKKRHRYNRCNLVRRLRLCRCTEHENRKPQCFDLLHDTRLLVAIGMKGYVKLFNALDTQEVDTNVLSSENVSTVYFTNPAKIIVKVMLAKDYSPEEHRGSNETKTDAKRREPAKLFLFSLDVKTVSVHKLKIYINDDGTPLPDRKSEVTHIITILTNPPQDPRTHGSKMFCYRPTFCFDGTTYLYFPKTSFEERTRIICRYNVQSRKKQDIISSPSCIFCGTEGPVDQLLGAGNNYLAFTTRDVDSTDVKLCIMHLNTRSNIVHCTLPSLGFERAESTEIFSKRESSVIGDGSWLDEFDGDNDKGVLCCYQAGCHNLKYVKWRPKENS